MTAKYHDLIEKPDKIYNIYCYKILHQYEDGRVLVKFGTDGIMSLPECNIIWLANIEQADKILQMLEHVGIERESYGYGCGYIHQENNTDFDYR